MDGSDKARAECLKGTLWQYYTKEQTEELMKTKLSDEQWEKLVASFHTSGIPDDIGELIYSWAHETLGIE